MNDTLLTPHQIEIVNEIMSIGMVAVYCDPKVSEKELIDLCSRIGFNFEDWKQENTIGD